MGYQKQQIAKVCEVCKGDFKGNSKQKYCSRECARKRQKQQLAALAEYRKKCPHCGEQLGPMTGKHRVRNGAADPTVAGVNGNGLSGPPARDSANDAGNPNPELTPFLPPGLGILS